MTAPSPSEVLRLLADYVQAEIDEPSQDFESAHLEDARAAILALDPATLRARADSLTSETAQQITGKWAAPVGELTEQSLSEALKVFKWLSFPNDFKGYSTTNEATYYGQYAQKRKTGAVIVGNVRKPVPEGYTKIYVGRASSYKPEYGENFSVLGNPYTMPKYTRDEAITEYRGWLHEALNWRYTQAGVCGRVDELISRIRSGENLALMCFCHPLSCHADCIKELLEGDV